LSCAWIELGNVKHKVEIDLCGSRLPVGKKNRPVTPPPLYHLLTSRTQKLLMSNHRRSSTVGMKTARHQDDRFDAGQEASSRDEATSSGPEEGSFGTLWHKRLAPNSDGLCCKNGLDY
jgi:hypothetical protein